MDKQRDMADETGKFDSAAVRALFVDPSFSDETWKDFIIELQSAKAAWLRDKGITKTFSPALAKKASKHMAAARKHIEELNQSSDFGFLAWDFCRNRSIDTVPSNAYTRDLEGFTRLEKLLAKLGNSKGKRGPDRTPIGFFVYRLCEAYTFLTDKPVTHTPYDGTNNYTSKSMSKSGKIITGIAKILAPEINESRIVTALRAYIAEHHSARKV